MVIKDDAVIEDAAGGVEAVGLLVETAVRVLHVDTVAQAVVRIGGVQVGRRVVGEPRLYSSPLTPSL